MGILLPHVRRREALGEIMIPKKRLSTAILFLLAGIACFLLNAFFPIISLVVIYFALRSLMKIAVITLGSEKYNRYKWHLVTLFVIPYPIAFLWGVATRSSADTMEWNAMWQVAGLFLGYVIIQLLFGLQIIRSLEKKGLIT